MAKKIDFIIAGAAKSGSTSLYNYLNSHPDIWLPSVTELVYWGSDDFYKMGESYLDMIYKDSPKKLLGCKYVHALYLQECAERLSDHNKLMKILIILRNPVKRAYSSYCFAKSYGWEKLDFKDAIMDENNRTNGTYIERTELTHISHGYYVDQIINYFEFFPKEQIHIVLLDDLIAYTENVVKECFNFLGVRSDNISEIDFTKKSNESAKSRLMWINNLIYSPNSLHKKLARKYVSPRLRYIFQEYITDNIVRLNRKPFKYPPMPEDIKLNLISLYKDYNSRLGKVLNRDLSSWDV